MARCESPSTRNRQALEQEPMRAVRPETLMHNLTVETPLFDQFERIAVALGDKTAVDSEGEYLSYLELLQLSMKIAAGLERVATRGEAVGVLVEQGPQFIAAILACLRTGIPFVPLDPSYPPLRLDHMIEQSDAKLILASATQASLSFSIAKEGRAVLNIDEILTESAPSNLPTGPDDIAYILFTSGSTASPKGVMQSGKSVLHNVIRHSRNFQITSEDRQTLLYPTSVYGGIRDIFNALLHGCSLYHFGVRERGYTDLGPWLLQKRITIYCSVASVFRHFASSMPDDLVLDNLRLIKLGGEATRRKDIELFESRSFHPDCVVFGGLASTETGMVRAYRHERGHPYAGSALPLGYAVDGVVVTLADSDGQPVAKGEPGEIIVTSKYISSGYINMPDETAEKFTANPDGSISYRMGDLAREDEQGCLTHLGRADSQIKIRGNRIEIGDVEAAILSSPEVKDVAVNVGENLQGEAMMVAYIIPDSSGNNLDLSLKVRDYLLSKVPKHMIPERFMVLQEFPYTPNGKLDRKALPEHTDQEDIGTFRPPIGMIEEWLIATVQDILKLEKVKLLDNFFLIGGNSLLAVQLVARLERELGRRLPLEQLAKAKTLLSVANWITDSDERWQPTTEIQAGIGSPALYMVPPVGGTLLPYFALRRFLPAQLPLIGVNFPEIQSQLALPTTIPRLGFNLAQSIREKQASGPYYVFGYSFGCGVAFETCKALIRSGEHIAGLLLLDPEPESRLRSGGPKDWAKAAQLYLTGLMPRRIRQLPIDDDPDEMFKTLRRAGMEDGELLGSGVLRLADYKRRNRAAKFMWRPKPETAIENVILLQTQSWTTEQKEEVTRLWMHLTNNSLQVADIPGDHWGVFRNDECLSKTAEVIQQLLERS